jgi:hypothetical protein
MKRLFALPVVVVALVSSAYAADSPCARAITKASAKYVLIRAKAIQRCHDARMKGSLPASTNCEANATVTAMTSAARSRFTNAVASKCGGNDGTCGTGDDLALSSYGWGGVTSCPTLQASSCSGPIANCGNIVTCLSCLDDEAVRQSLGLATGSLDTAQFGSDSALNKCQRAIAKGLSKFLGSTAKASSKCWEGRIKGQHSSTCPVPGDPRTAKLLTRAEEKKVAYICKSCGGADRLCNGNGDLAPSDIGFPSSCPAVTVPGGSSCAGSVGTLSQLVDCVDCVATFDDRCVDAAAVPGQTAYPSQCGSGGTTTTTTTIAASSTTSTSLPPGGTFVDFTTSAAGGTCGHTYSDTSGTTVIKNLTCGGLSLGGANSTVPEGPTPDGSTNRWVADCSGGSSCSLTALGAPGPTYDCTNTGCNFGTPLPIVNGGLSTCVDNKFAAPSGGTLDTTNGDASISVALNATAVLTGIPAQPCPICRSGSTSGPACTGSPASPCTGVCEGGPDQTNACTSTNSQGLSRDCRQPLAPGSGNRCYRGTNNGAACSTGSQCPGGTCAQQVGVIPVTLTPLTTGTSQLSDPNGMFCPGQAQAGCFTNPNSTACRLIRETGDPAGPLTIGVPASTILASTFCVPASSSSLINGATSLPGPGATTLPGTVVIIQTSTTTPGSSTTSTSAAPTTSSTAGPSTTSTSTTTSTTTSTEPAPGTVVLDFSTASGSGACGSSKNASNAVIRNLACGSLNLGGGGSTVPEGPIPDGATNRFLVTNCAGSACDLDASLGGGVGIDCTTSGCAFGPPLPIANAGLSTCVVNSFASDAGGTVNTSSGALSLNVPLSSHVYVTGNGSQPCPRCSATGSAGNPGQGTCDRGARAGQPCATTNSIGLSADCVPGGADGSSDLGSISVDLTPLITGTASDSDTLGLFCPAQTTGGNEGCFGSTACRSFSQTGMPAGPLVPDVSQPIALASAFCIPATGNVLIDGAASLPGPGAASLAGNVVLHEIGPTSSTTSTTVPTTSSSTGISTTTTTSSSTSTSTLLPLPPLIIEFSSTTGTTDCGAARDGSGAVLTPLTCGNLYLGNGATGIAPSALPDGAVNRFSLNTGDLGCLLSLLTACPIGPTNTSGPGFDCTTTGCSFGPPVPVPNGALSACSVSTFTAPSTGTVNLVTGATTANVSLGLHLYVTGNAGQPCPRCSATGSPSAPGSGTCDRGARSGLACTTTNSQGLSKDCAPGGTDGSVDLGTVVANLSPVTTGTSSKSNPGGLFCPGQTVAGCFGHSTCRSFSETGAAPNAALSSVTPQPATLASTFCVPSSGSVLVDGSAGLPGPAAISLPGMIRGSF